MEGAGSVRLCSEGGTREQKSPARAEGGIKHPPHPASAPGGGCPRVPPLPTLLPTARGTPGGKGGGMRVGQQLCGEGVPWPFLGGHGERWVVWPPAAGGFGGARWLRGGLRGGSAPRPGCPVPAPSPGGVRWGQGPPAPPCVWWHWCHPTGWEGVSGAATGPLLAWLWDPVTPSGHGLGQGLGASLGRGG